jgi:hypothetical protein
MKRDLSFQPTDEWVPHRGDVWVDSQSGAEWLVDSEIFPEQGNVYCRRVDGRGDGLWNIGVFKFGRFGRKLTP